MVRVPLRPGSPITVGQIVHLFSSYCCVTALHLRNETADVTYHIIIVVYYFVMFSHAHCFMIIKMAV